MTQDNVRRFFEQFEANKELRKKLYAAEGAEGREAALREHGMHFTNDEFDSMVDAIHVKCQTHEEAERFFEIRNWWNVLRGD